MLKEVRDSYEDGLTNLEILMHYVNKKQESTYMDHIDEDFCYL